MPAKTKKTATPRKSRTTAAKAGAKTKAKKPVLTGEETALADNSTESVGKTKASASKASAKTKTSSTKKTAAKTKAASATQAAKATKETKRAVKATKTTKTAKSTTSAKSSTKTKSDLSPKTKAGKKTTPTPAKATQTKAVAKAASAQSEKPKATKSTAKTTKAKAAAKPATRKTTPKTAEKKASTVKATGTRRIVNAVKKVEPGNPTSLEGVNAPPLRLPANNGQIVSLDDFEGKFVVLYFYPKDNTPGCEQQARDFEKKKAQFSRKGVVLLGISPDGIESHNRFAEKCGIRHLLLSDVDHSVAESYGVWREKTLLGRKFWSVKRTTFILDKERVIRKVFEVKRVEDHAADVLAALKGLK